MMASFLQQPVLCLNSLLPTCSCSTCQGQGGKKKWRLLLPRMRYPLLFLCSIQSLSVQTLPKTSQSTPLYNSMKQKRDGPSALWHRYSQSWRLQGWLVAKAGISWAEYALYTENLFPLGKGEWPEKLSAYLLYAFFQREYTASVWMHIK